MTISALPTPPDRSDPATFSSRADAFLGALPTFATEANALGTQANSDAAVAAAAAIGTLAASGTSTDSLTIGTGSKSFTTQTGKAITAGMTMKWAMQSDATKYMTGTVTSYDAGTGALVMNMTATNGSGTSSAWEGVVTGLPPVSVSIGSRSVSSADSVVAGDLGKVVSLTGTGYTLSLPDAATVGAGFHFRPRNSGTGVVTIDPYSTQTADGQSSLRIYPQEAYMLVSDGANWISVGRQRLVLIGTSTVSSPVSTVDFETGFDDTEFDEIIVRGYGVAHNGAAARLPRLRLKLAGAYATASYVYQAIDSASTTIAAYDQTTTAVALQMTSTTVAVADKFSMEARVQNISTATNQEHVVDWVCHALGGRRGQGRGGNSGGSAVQGLRLLMNADSISAGTFNVYGMRKS